MAMTKKSKNKPELKKVASRPKAPQVPTLTPYGHGQPPTGEIQPLGGDAPVREIRPFGSGR